MKSSQSKVIERLQQAQNAQDLEAFLACFAPNFQSEHPLHPERAIQGIQGVEHVRKNWSTVFHNIPDFHSELLRSAVEGDTIWAEWHWCGTRRDSTRYGMRGVTILGVQADQIEWARLYMEPV